MNALDGQEAALLGLAGDALHTVDQVAPHARRLDGRIGPSTLRAVARQLRTTGARAITTAALLERIAREASR